MDMILAVFRSRAQTLDFVARLKRMGASASAVSTPKDGQYGAFVGFFRVRAGYGGVSVRRIG